MDKIFILGSGPSLNKQKGFMPELGQQTTFCCNRMNEWDGLCFTPTYYVCNLDIVEQGLEPNRPPYEKAKFIISQHGESLRGWTPYTKVGDAPLSMQGNLLRSGGTMPYLAAQIAVRLGYTELYFLGIEQKGPGHCWNPEGDDWPFVPHRLDKTLGRWKEMKEFYEAEGISLRDCTPDGLLNGILGYVSLTEVLSGVLV